MRQLWILMFLAGMGGISAGQQIPPPPPPQPQTTQTSPSAQPAQQPTTTTTAPAEQTQQPATSTTAPATPTQQTAPATAQQPETPAPAAPAQQTAPEQQPATTTTAPAPAQQPATATPAAPAQQTTTAPAQQQPTVPTTPQIPTAQQSAQEQQQVEQQLGQRAKQAVREADERWQLEQEAARQEAIVSAQEEAQKAQQKADKAREEAQKQQAKANAAKQKAQGLQAGAPLPQSDRPDMTEAEYRRQFLRVREKDLDRLKASHEVMREFTTAKIRISAGLLKDAKCIVIIPATKRAAIGVGGNYGRGAMTCRLGETFDGPWSAPSMMALEGASFGLQFGIQGTDWVLLIMNERGISSLLSTKSKLGGDASIAAGPWGRSTHRQICGCSRSMGAERGGSHRSGDACSDSVLRPYAWHLSGNFSGRLDPPAGP